MTACAATGQRNILASLVHLLTWQFRHISRGPNARRSTTLKVCACLNGRFRDLGITEVRILDELFWKDGAIVP